MERFESFFEDENTEVANEGFAELWEKFVKWMAPNYKKGLQNLKERAKDADNVTDIKDVLDDAKKLQDTLESIIDDSQHSTMLVSWGTAWQRFKTIWPILLPGVNLPLFVTGLASAIKENTREARKEKTDMGMPGDFDYLQKRLFELAKGSIGDVKKLVKLLEEKLKKAEKSSK